jgi:hypothetical protein
LIMGYWAAVRDVLHRTPLKHPLVWYLALFVLFVSLGKPKIGMQVRNAYGIAAAIILVAGGIRMATYKGEDAKLQPRGETDPDKRAVNPEPRRVVTPEPTPEATQWHRCGTCGGTGFFERMREGLDEGGDESPDRYPCHTCGGSGWVQR